MKRYLMTAVALLAAGILSLTQATAQTAQKQQTFESFTGINVSGDFQVTLTPGTEYATTLTVDEAIMPYVQCFVTGGVLSVTVGKLPKEVKKLFKGKNKPTYILVVTAPQLGNITLKDNATLMTTNNFTAGTFRLDLSGKSQVRHLTVVDAASADIIMSKNAIADLTIDADQVNAELSGSAQLRLNYNVETLKVQSKNSALISANGDAGQTTIVAEGSSKISLDGLSEELLDVKGGGSANIDCLKLETKKANIVLTGATLVEAASEEISVELSGKSTLIFDNDPVVNVVSIKTSTMTRYSAAK
ncbi:MAG: DUF2807 domain-containing protein [Bacteroidota bacterium]|nr:DUF2807 domain-containing protein [Bacteroidota bacterium]